MAVLFLARIAGWAFPSAYNITLAVERAQIDSRGCCPPQLLPNSRAGDPEG